MKSQVYSLKGKKNVNQDFVLVKEINDLTTLFLIVDGMGGYEDGDIAAKIVAENIWVYLSIAKKVDEKQIQIAVNKANLAIRQYSEKHKVKLGATLAGAILINKMMICFWLGDVKIYHINGKNIVFESISHNMLNELKLYSSLSTEKIKKYKHVVTKAVFGDLKKSVLDFYIVPNLSTSDSLLICSDGFYEVYSAFNFINHIDSENGCQEIDTCIKSNSKDDASYIFISDFLTPHHSSLSSNTS